MPFSKLTQISGNEMPVHEIPMSICKIILRNAKRIGPFTALATLDLGPESSVGIATGYGLDGLGIESRCGRHFPHLFRPALGHTQLPVQWVPGLSRG